MEGHAVGPILVLSYKNHALDEFLNDVISQYPNTPAHVNYRSHRQVVQGLQPGMLIRTGKPELECLENFAERSSPFERDAQNHLLRIIKVQRQTRNVFKLWTECARSIQNNTFFDVSLSI